MMLWEYIKSRGRTIALILLLCGVLVLVGWLGGMSRGAILYCLGLCAALCCVAFVSGFRHFFIKHRQMELAKEQVLVSLENLPLPEDRIEEDYQELVELLRADRVAHQNDTDLHDSEMLDYFTLWAHQIKTPISAMQLIMQSEPERYSEELGQELFKIEQYVEMVLSYLRLDSDYTDFVLRRYSVDSMIKQSVRKYAKQFIRKKISLVYEGTEATVVTDEKWMCFVLDQLLSNALKYTASGQIRITADNEGIVIEDTGIGIAAEDLPRVFEKGYTGYNGRTDKKSTGIGLYLCKRILTKLGHEISIASEPGKGTRVTVGFGEE